MVVSGQRVIDISEQGGQVRLRQGCLVVEVEGRPPGVVALEDLGAVVLGHPEAVMSTSAMAATVEAGAAVVVCNRQRTPCGLLLPLDGHCWQTKRMLGQVAMGVVQRKRLWQGVVRWKIRAQAALLEALRGDDGGLRAMAKAVRSGDAGNAEGRAAAAYWPMLFNDVQFRRRTDGTDQNALLNYGYAVMRACVGRAVTAAGLHPSLGLFHHGRENAMGLVDDLLEPYRPLVDGEVAELVGTYGRLCAVDAESKRRLVGVLGARLATGAGETRTVSECVMRTAQSLAAVALGERSVREGVWYPEGLVRW